MVRLPYSGPGPHKIVRKLRRHPGVMRLLTEFQPEAILFHGTCGWELLTAANYVKAHPHVPLYVDSHEDWNNSARTFTSRELLHRRYYGPILRRALPYVRKILCLSTESIDFVHELYRVPRDLLEFYPLGGRPVPDQEYELRRAAARSLYGLGPQEIAFVQSGKQTKRKKLIESLTAFAAVPNARFRLLIAGVLSEDIRKEATSLIASDPRVSFLGWKSPEELTSLLCAADIYLQPGTQSATMQNSLCARCAVILDDVPAHAVYYRENGWLIGPNRSLLSVLSDISTKNPDLARMQATSFEVAKSMLDYAVLAERVLR